jgi:lysophospholipase L1-like esterase
MTYRRYVALGSSYAAGPGIDPLIDRAAGRSGRNYPHLLAQALGAALTDATVSGATTATILKTHQRTLGRTRPPQVRAVHADTDLVTVTAGGNDLGYIGAVLSAAVRNRLLDSRLAPPLVRRLWPTPPPVMPSAEQIEAATQGLVGIVAEVRRRAGHAHVVLVDYLPLFADLPPAYATAFLHAEQVQHLRLVGKALSGVFTTAAERSGADVVSADSYAPGHTVGSSDPWVSGLSLRHLPSSFHPTAAGMRAVADTLLARLSRP